MSGQIPQGVEVLVKKASVDPQFAALLLDCRAAAARDIGLQLEPAEVMMLDAVPREQLETIIARTTVPQEQRRAFLGHAAAAMLAAIGAVAGVGERAEAGGIGGIRGDAPPATSRGIQPDRPPETSRVDSRVREIVAKRSKVDKTEITAATSFGEDLKADAAYLVGLKKDLEKQFKIRIPSAAFKKMKTVGDAVQYIEKAVKGRGDSPPDRPSTKSGPGVIGSFGNRPDRPIGPLGGSRPDRPSGAAPQQ